MKKEDEWWSLVQLFLQAKTKERMSELLHLLLTISERDSLVDRYRIIEALLRAKKPQREISQDLKVSIAKITAGSNELKRCSEELKTFLRKEMNT